MPLFAVHYQRDAGLARDHLLQRQPPGFAEPVRKRGGQIERIGHVVLLQDWKGVGDEILVAAVKGQRDEARAHRRRQRAMAGLVHGDDVVFPALQRPDGAVEEPRGDLVRLMRLEQAHMRGTDVLEPQHHAGPAGLTLLQPRIEAEIRELHLCPLQKPVFRCHPMFPQSAPRSAQGIVLTLC
ncbi:hypothetical protein ES703_118055 [subsurface metagenome]